MVADTLPLLEVNDEVLCVLLEPAVTVVHFDEDNVGRMFVSTLGPETLCILEDQLKDIAFLQNIN